jgi:hypothetical protein
VFEDVGAVALQLLTTVQPLVVAVLVVVELDSSFLAHDTMTTIMQPIMASQNIIFFILPSHFEVLCFFSWQMYEVNEGNASF